MQKFIFFILCSQIAGHAFAATIHYQPVKGSAEYCKDGLLLTTSSKVVGSKYKLGKFSARRYYKDKAGNAIFVDGKYGIFQGTKVFDPRCEAKNLFYKFPNCGAFTIEHGLIHAKYADYSQDEVRMTDSNTFGFEIYPILTTFEIKIQGGHLDFRKFYGPVDRKGALDKTLWQKLLFGAQSEHCIYQRVR